MWTAENSIRAAGLSVVLLEDEPIAKAVGEIPEPLPYVWREDDRPPQESLLVNVIILVLALIAVLGFAFKVF